MIRYTMCLVLCIIQVTSAARFALLIGNALGGSEVSALKFVDNDLKSVKKTLNDYCGFPRKHIITVSGKGPEDVVAALDRLAGMLPPGEDNLLLLYYTGHADRDHLKMGNNRFAITDVKKKFSAFPASIRIGIFDACQSGSFTRLKGGELAEPFLFKDAEKIEGEVILSSSSPTENAQESDLLGNSIFTFHFVNALRGSGDQSGDGKVTLSEAYQYTYNHTVSSTARTWGGVQHPSYRFRIQGEGDVVLADLTTGAMGVLLEGDIAGTVTMTDSVNNIVADLSKERGSRMIIALNPGSYQIMVGNSNGEKWLKNIAVAPKKLVPVDMRQFEKFDPVQIQHKGGREQFRLGVALSGSYGQFDLQSTAAGLRRAFADFDQFGITPGFIENGDGIFAGGKIRLKVRERIVASFGISRMSLKKNGSFTGAFRSDGFDQTYKASLTVDEQFALTMVEWGVGYCFSRWFIRGTVLLAGVNCYLANHSITSIFTDELYDIAAKQRFSEAGFMMIPWCGGGYTYAFARNYEVGLIAHYRYQGIPHPLTTSTPGSSRTRLDYDFSGVDVSLHFSAYLVKRSNEK